MLITCWQVIGPDGQWRFSTPDTAALIACNRDNCVRLADAEAPHGIRFRRAGRARVNKGVTPLRLSAAKRAMAKQVEKAGLFGHMVAAEQPTPEERIERLDKASDEWAQDRRDYSAVRWRRARAVLLTLTEEARARCLFHWSVCGCPGHPEFLLDHLRKYTESGQTSPTPALSRATQTAAERGREE